ncbi:unnamed protein product [Aureobasidium uvarum]|uniref:Uncharacterized protein n=1 Tax=Aureobasidium uvarum TaxID=2773716 RepID=A0A9N8PWD4_9PEZI|nr:unnamed protein product [Aureobasidium uvarum]
MDGNDKGVRPSSGLTTLSTLEGLVEAYAASDRSRSPAFIHAGDLDRQSYIDARREPFPVSSPGPAPSLLPPPTPAYRPVRYRGEDESDEAVPTPPTRILDRAPPPPVSRFLSGLSSGVFDAEESDHDSVSEMGQQEDALNLGKVKASQPYETSFGKFKLFPDSERAPKTKDPQHSTTPPPLPLPLPSIRTQASAPSLAPTIPLDISSYDDDQDLILERQDKPTPRLIESARTHSLANDSAWLQRSKQGKRRSWALFVVCSVFPFILFIFAFGGFDKVMVQLAGTHARPTLYQKSFAKYLCVVEVVAWPSLAA